MDGILNLMLRFMKQTLFCGVLGTLLAASCLGQTAQRYENIGIVGSGLDAPIVDAIEFINSGTFNVSRTLGLLVSSMRRNLRSS